VIAEECANDPQACMSGPQQYSLCFSLFVVQGCIGDSGGNAYYSYGYGLGSFGPTVSIGPAPCSSPYGTYVSIDGNYFAGGGVNLSSNGATPYAEFGRPGAGIFLMHSRPL